MVNPTNKDPRIKESASETPLDKVPTVLLEHVFSYIPPQELPKVQLTSKKFYKAGLDSIIKREARLVKEFINSLAKDLDTKPFLSNDDVQAIYNSKNMKQLQRALLSCHEKVLDSLATIPVDKLKEYVKNWPNELLPTLFKNVFEVAEIYANIPQKDTFGEHVYYREVNIASCKLADIGEFDRAQQLAEELPSFCGKSEVLVYIAEKKASPTIRGQIGLQIYSAYQRGTAGNLEAVLSKISHVIQWIFGK